VLLKSSGVYPPPHTHTPHPEFLQLDPAEQIPAHQDLLRAGKLVRYQPSFKNRVIFASHQVRDFAATPVCTDQLPPYFHTYLSAIVTLAAVCLSLVSLNPTYYSCSAYS
jgi:hypothetical protein